MNWNNIPMNSKRKQCICKKNKRVKNTIERQKRTKDRKMKLLHSKPKNKRMNNMSKQFVNQRANIMQNFRRFKTKIKNSSKSKKLWRSSSARNK
jgi:hypothetical protein